MRPYLDLLDHIRTTGLPYPDRTGTGCRGLVGHQMRFDLQQGFPLVTTKTLHVKSVIHELLWFLSGSTRLRPLLAAGVRIWSDWPLHSYRRFCAETLNLGSTPAWAAVGTAFFDEVLGWPEAEIAAYRHFLASGDHFLASGDQSSRREDLDKFRDRLAAEAVLSQREFESRILDNPGFDAAWGDLGPIYGKQWRRWATADGREIDQVARVIADLKTNPYGRRHIINAWNPGDLDDPSLALPWCHAMWQFVATTDGKLHLHLTQRSCDTFLGLPFNIASGALLLTMVAQIVGRTAGDFIWTGVDVHLYDNHRDQAALQLSREPRPLPRLILNPAVTDIDGFTYEDVIVTGYAPWPAIPAPVAV